MNKILYNILKAVTAITDIVDTRIYPVNAPQGAAMPYIIVDIDEVVPSPTKDNIGKIDTYSIDFTCFSSNYDEIATLQDEIRSALDRYKDSNIDRAYFKGQETNYDEQANIYLIISEYDIRRKI